MSQDNNNEEEDLNASFREFLGNFISSVVSRRRPTPDIHTGDRCKLYDHTDVSYLIPEGLENNLGHGKEDANDGLKYFFITVGGIVEVLNKPIEYKCGHCNMLHQHDAKIYYPIIDKAFFCSMDMLEIVSK